MKPPFSETSTSCGPVLDHCQGLLEQVKGFGSPLSLLDQLADEKGSSSQSRDAN